MPISWGHIQPEVYPPGYFNNHPTLTKRNPSNNNNNGGSASGTAVNVQPAAAGGFPTV